MPAGLTLSLYGKDVSASDAVKGLGDSAEQVSQRMPGMFAGVGEKIASHLTDSADGVNGLRDASQRVSGQVPGMFAGVGAKIGSHFGDADGAVRDVGDTARRVSDEIPGEFAGVGGRIASQFGDARGKITSIFDDAGGDIVAGMASVGGLAAAGFTSAFQQSTSAGTLQAKLGIDPAEAGQLATTAGDIFASNWGESMDDVNNAVATVKQGLGGLVDDAHLEDLTTQALAFQQTFGVETAESVKAVGQMLRTGLASDAEQAFDILTTGEQLGLDKAGDLIDTFNEYGTQFRKLGVDGPTALGLINQGLQAGARDADIVADSMKEFSIRALDGSQTTIDGFQSLGLNAEQMASRIGAGGKSASAGLGTVLTALRNISDPVERERIAVELFGTQAEDLGSALFALNPATATAGTGMSNLAGSTGRMTDAIGSTASPLDNLSRSVMGVVGDLAEGLVPVVQTVAPLLSAAAPAIVAVGTAFLTWKAISGARALLSNVPDLLVKARGTALAAGDGVASFASRTRSAGSATGSFFASYGKGLAVLGGTAAVAGLAGKAIADVVDADTAYLFENLGSAVRDLNTDLVNSKGNADGAARQWAQSAVASSGLAEKAAAAGITIQELTTAIMGGRDGAGQLAQKWRELGDPSDATIIKLGALGAGYDQATAAAKRNATGTDQVAGAQRKAKQSLDPTTASMQSQKASADALLASLKGLSGDKIDAAQAELRFKDGLAQSTEQVKQNGRSLSDNTSKGRANREWLLTQLSSLRDVASAQLDAGQSTDVVTGKLYSNRAALERAAIAAGLSSDEVRALVRQFGQMPARKATSITAPGADKAAASVGGLLANIKGLSSKSVNITADVTQTPLGKFHFAQGTGFAPGGIARVNEQGHEEMYLPRGSQVITADTAASRRRMAGNGDTVIQVQVPDGVTDPYNYGRRVAEGLTVYLSRGGSGAGLTRALGVN